MFCTATYPKIEYKLAFDLKKTTPYFALKGKLWDINFENSEEKLL